MGTFVGFEGTTGGRGFLTEFTVRGGELGGKTGCMGFTAEAEDVVELVEYPETAELPELQSRLPSLEAELKPPARLGLNSAPFFPPITDGKLSGAIALAIREKAVRH